MADENAPPGKAVRDPKTYEKNLDAWMRKSHPDRDGLQVHDVDMPTATGFSNETVFYSATWSESGGDRTERYVARIEPPDGGIFPVQNGNCEVSVEVQHRLMSVVGKSGVAPVPPLLPYEGDTSVLGRPFFVMEFVDGKIPADVPRYSTDGFVAKEATPAERERMLMNGIENMAALHSLDWQKDGLDWLDPSDDGNPAMSHQLDIYRKYVMSELKGREHPVMLQCLDYLDANIPEAKSGLSWGDARLGNIIWQDYQCASVVDWEAAAICPPEADIGWWVMFDRMSFDDMEAPRLEGFPTREQMVTHWESCTGRRVASDILYWEIYAVMRFCAIFIKLGDRMTGAGLAPAEANISVQNGVTEALSRLLERA